MFVHVTVEPTEILIGFGMKPPLTIVALTDVGVGAVGELPFPHAIAAVNSITANVIFIRRDMITSPRIGKVARELPDRKVTVL